MNFISNEDQKSLTTDLAKDVDKCKGIAGINQLYDVTFKVLVLLISIAIVVTSALGSSKVTNKVIKNPETWSLFATILGGISTATSVFAFSQFNFASRQQIWNIKSQAYDYLLFQLKYLNPNVAEWGKTKHIVDSWNDFTTPEQAILPELKPEDELQREIDLVLRLLNTKIGLLTPEIETKIKNLEVSKLEDNID